MENTNSGWLILLIIAIILVIIAVVGYVESRDSGVSTWVWIVLVIAIFIAILGLVLYYRTRKPTLQHHHSEIHHKDVMTSHGNNYTEHNVVHTHVH